MRRYQFCAGHRIVGHGGKCINIHGHNYVAEIHARANELNDLGMVVDFSVLKERVGGWIDDNLDHTFIASPDEREEVLQCLSNTNKKRAFKLPYNPTAENIAKYILEEVCPKLMEDTGVVVYKIVLWETENCHATAELGV
jgi:6-pyruvoyltetrahydropterin/6-carboxytetrahydropterin synthase